MPRNDNNYNYNCYHLVLAHGLGAKWGLYVIAHLHTHTLCEWRGRFPTLQMRHRRLKSADLLRSTQQVAEAGFEPRAFFPTPAAHVVWAGSPPAPEMKDVPQA